MLGGYLRVRFIEIARYLMVRIGSIAVAFGVLCHSSTYCADAPYLRTGNVELGGFVGSSYGVDSWRVMGGGNVSWAVRKRWLPYAEVSYFPGISRFAPIENSSAKVSFDLPLLDYHAGVHYRIVIRESRIVPYLVAGAGGIRTFATTYRVPPADGFPQFTVSDQAHNAFAANFGGGIRYYVRERYGFRTEFKVYTPRGTYTDPFYKATIGFFFQVR